MLTQRLTSSLLRASCTVTRQVRASISPSSFSIFASASVSARNASSLVYIEHRDGVLNDSTLHAVSAAQKADSTAKQGVDALIVGTPSEVASVVPQVSKIAGLSKIYTAKNEAYAHGMAETIAPVVTRFLTSSTPGAEIKHLFAAHTAVGKNLFPRVSGLLDVSMIADIIDVSYDPAADVTEFSRPIYAGNAVVRVKTDGKLDKIRVVTVRTTAFDKAVQEGGEAVEEDIEAVVEECEFLLISQGEGRSRDRRLQKIKQPTTWRPDTNQDFQLPILFYFYFTCSFPRRTRLLCTSAHRSPTYRTRPYESSIQNSTHPQPHPNSSPRN